MVIRVRPGQRAKIWIFRTVLGQFATIITREMQSINGASLRVLDSSIEIIVLRTFES